MKQMSMAKGTLCQWTRSEQPDHIIQNILSLSPTGEVIQMSLVSKYWKQLCYNVPILQLNTKQKMTQSKRRAFFSYFYTRLKGEAKGPLVSKLKLDICGCFTNSSFLYKWFSLVTDMYPSLTNLKELGLCFGTVYRITKYYLLPRIFLSMKSLIRQRLCGVRSLCLVSVNLM